LTVSTNPDIIFGTETWIDSNIKDSQIFPSGYTIFRKNRNCGGGGVLIAVKDIFIVTSVLELQTDCEIVWCKLELVGHKTVYLSCFYNPKTSNENGYLEFERSINRADTITNAFIITAGDFNLPGWETKSLKANTQHVNIHHKFTDILDDHGLVQMVEEPTRESNTLDLIITNFPNCFNRIETIPGLSDHDIVFAELKTIPTKRTQRPRKIPLYKKAKWENIKDKLKMIKEEIEKMYKKGNSTQELWDYFKKELEDSIDENIPKKQLR
jgi:hypothetical protein